MTNSKFELYKYGRKFLFDGLRNGTIEKNTSNYSTIIANLIFLRGKNSYKSYPIQKEIEKLINSKRDKVKFLTGKFFQSALLLEQEGNLEKYKGNHNQIKLAKDSGISHLGHLYSALSSLGYVEKLEYTKIHLPYKILENLIDLLEKEGGIEKYKGNHNQIKLAKDSGISHLGSLYSALSSLGYTGELEYNIIDLPYKTLEILIDLLNQKGSIEKYKGSHNQIQLAKDSGISNLGCLESALSSLGYIKKLGYKQINLPYKKLEKLIDLLEQEGSIERYKGNHNQIQLAKDSGISHLRHLYSALSSLGYVEKLGYNIIDLSYKKLENFKN